MGTKGTWRRPTAVDEDRLERNWRLAFGVREQRTTPAPSGQVVWTDASGEVHVNGTGAKVAEPPADR